MPLSYCGNFFPFPYCVYRLTNRITHRSLSTGLISRTVRVELHAKGYNANRILTSIKANPIPGVQDHLIVWFFNEDTSKDCVVSGSGMSGAVPKVDDTLSPPLSAVNVVVLGRLGIARGQ